MILMCHRCWEPIERKEPRVSVEHGKHVVWAYHAKPCEPYADTWLVYACDFDALSQLQRRGREWRTVQDLHLPGDGPT